MTSKWPLVTLGDLCSKVTDGSHNPPKGIAESDYLMLSSRDIQDDNIAPVSPRYLTEDEFHLEHRRTDLTPGDVLLTIVGTIGRSAIYSGVPKLVTLQRSVAVLTPICDRLDARYLMYFFHSSTQYFEDKAQGTAQKGFYLGQLREMRMPLPPLDEQKRIVAKLDEALSNVDGLIENIQNSIFQVNEFSKSAVSEVIEKQVVDLGSVRMDEVFTIARGGSPRPIKKFITQSSDGINWIKISDASRTGKYITDTTEKITKDGVSRSRVVNSGDLLLSNSMSFGRPYILKTDGCIHDGWLVLSSKRNDVDTEFMYYLLGSQYVYRQFDNLAAGSTVRNLNKELVASVKIPLPTIELQKTLMNRFQEIEGATDSLLRNMTNRLIDAENLKGSILAAAFAGDF